MTPEAALQASLDFYRRFLEDWGLSRRYQGRKAVYDILRDLPDSWEARHTRDIKIALDDIDNEVAGRDTTSDWRKR